MLIGLLFDAPLLAASQRWPKKLHAVTMEGVMEGFDRQTFQAACGAAQLRLVGTRQFGETLAALWPPRLKGMPVDKERCQVCYVATGKMRPRTEYKTETQ